jgi:hypothetical protein
MKIFSCATNVCQFIFIFQFKWKNTMCCRRFPPQTFFVSYNFHFRCNNLDKQNKYTSQGDVEAIYINLFNLQFAYINEAIFSADWDFFWANRKSIYQRKCVSFWVHGKKEESTFDWDLKYLFLSKFANDELES